jgi:UDP-glucose 4-epimerase
MNMEATLGYCPVRALVTGGAGFIGSHVVDALVERGDDVWALDNLASGRRENVNKGARFVEVDIRDASALERACSEAKPEVCFHLAAQADVRVSIAEPALDAEVNVIGTANVLEAARASDAKVVFSSTGGAIYGACDRPAGEDSPRLPLAPYGTSKLAGEEYLATWSRLYETGHVSLRFGNVYGPRQDPHGEAGVVAIFFGRIAGGQELRIFGDGRQTRDYVFVADVVAATLAAPSGRAGVYNVGTGIETSVLELAEGCKRASGVDAEVVFDPPRLGELSRSVLDPSRAETALGWRPLTSIDQGLEATWNFVRAAEGEGGIGAN